MKQENQRIVLTKRLLKEGLLQLLQEKDLDQISVTALCQQAQINRATFYRHYEVPRDVLIEIERDFYHRLQQEVSLPETEKDVRRSLAELCVCLERNRELLQIIIRSNSDLDLALFLSEIYQGLWLRLEGIRTQLGLDLEDVMVLSRYSAGGCYLIVRGWILGDIQKSAQEMAERIYALLKKTVWPTLDE